MGQVPDLPAATAPNPSGHVGDLPHEAPWARKLYNAVIGKRPGLIAAASTWPMSSRVCTTPAKTDVSGDMALRIEKAFGVKMDTLMRMQASYDIARTRKRESTIRVRPFEPSVGQQQ